MTDIEPYDKEIAEADWAIERRLLSGTRMETTWA